MIFIPIRTEMVSRRTPVMNYALLAVNVLVFAAFNVLARDQLDGFRERYLVLQGEWPSLHQFFTYQFVHADPWHLAGNMLFLWVFGNSVNAKLGDLAYGMFYLAGGVFAALTFLLGNTAHLLGASGSIAAVTTAYLVLFPRSRVTVLFIFFFITFVEVPAMVLIVVKVILWDNIVAPRIHGAGDVAIAAHIGGYAFGFVAAMTMLLIKVVPRDHFDLLGLVDRWNRRRAYRATMADPDLRRAATYGTVGRAPLSEAERKQEEARLDRIGDLRTRIGDRLTGGDMDGAIALYEELTTLDSGQCLSARDQLEIAKGFYARRRTPQAAGAFERYLSCYRTGTETDEIRLLLGIIYARDLQQYGAAEKHLSACVDRLKGDDRKNQCQQWLDHVRQYLGRPAIDG
ncbi:MAG: rhomboid family intramembrane serine protease [Phycisphaerales bacterium]|nr:rhomboid family intramembrane serine protease [Phycisphaerales bacterium]